MMSFTPVDAPRLRIDPRLRERAIRRLALIGAGGLVLAIALAWLSAGLTGPVRLLVILVGVALPGVVGLAAAAGAAIIAGARPLGALLPRIAIGLFVAGVVGIIVLAWIPALLYRAVDAVQASAVMNRGTHDVLLRASEIAAELSRPGRALEGWQSLAGVAGHILWPLQFQLTRDLLSVLGVVGFVSLVAMFAIWWERKVAGRIQSRLGPMRVGGWHGWAQSLADGLKLLQKEDIFIGGADRPLFRLAPYLAFVPALSLFIALPFSAAWICRDLDVGLIFIFALLSVGVLGVLLGGWASNNKWSMYGAMREACQMISYEIPLGFSLLVPVMLAGTLRLTQIGELQSEGFHTWLAFANPFAFTAAVLFFTATLAECKRAPFDLPEAESELVAGYHTEYSGFRWALFFFAEYAEMFAVGALATILFFGAWHSPLPASWGAGLKQGPLWQQALHGLLFSGPLWFVAKGFFFMYVQIWLRWTLPRIRLDQVMYACVQVMLPLAMLVLLGNTVWGVLVPAASWLAVLVSVLLALLGAALLVAMLAIMVYGFRKRRALVGTLVVAHLPGA